MANDPAASPKQVSVPPLSDTPHAPLIFYENAPVFSFLNGVVNITLSASRSWIDANSNTVSDHVVVAYLRGNIQAALSLRAAIDQALLLAAPVQEGKAN
jgi:hypothetical protein